MAITKAQIDLNIGESYSIEGRKITRNKPIVTTDQAVIKFWEKHKPRVTIKTLAKTPDPIPSKTMERDRRRAEYEKLREEFEDSPRSPRVPAGLPIDIRDKPDAPTKSDGPAEAAGLPAPVKWTPASSVAELREACASRDIAFAKGDTKNTLIAMLTESGSEDDADKE
jgi:hypothetical protein